MEMFCQLVALPDERGNTLLPSQAYRLAYPRAKTSHAARLMKIEAVLDRIDDLRTQAEQALMRQVSRTGIAVKARRIQRKDRHWRRLLELIEVRSAEFSVVPGHETGLLVCLPCQIAGERVDVYKLDKAALDCLLRLEESVARELGQLEADGPGEDSRVVIHLPDNGR